MKDFSIHKFHKEAHLSMKCYECLKEEAHLVVKEGCNCMCHDQTEPTGFTNNHTCCEN